MDIGYYDKLLTFLNHDVEKLNVNDILAKGEKLGVTFPNSLVRFYYYFGNCDEVLNGYYKFFKLEDIKIWHEGIVFGTNDENGTLGIKLKDLNDIKDPTVYYTCEDTDDWFSELNYHGSEAFFFNIACMNILYNKSYVAAANISKAKYNDEISNNENICTFTDDDTINNGYQRSGFLDKSGKILGSNWSLIGRIMISGDNSEDLEKFIKTTDLNFKPFSFTPEKKLKKTKKLPKIDNDIMTDCYDNLSTFLPNPIEKTDPNIILAKGEELGVKLPQQLVDFYRYFGSSDKFLDSFFIFNKLEDIHIKNNVLMFGAANEYYSFFGIDIDCIDYDEPYVTEYSNDECTEIIDSYGASSFFFNAACF